MPSFTSADLITTPQPNPGQSLPTGMAPVFRNAKDARLASYGESTDVNYPDGYLGTLHGRREDKTFTSMRTNSRSYSRGVHKGERVNPGDYVWPEEFNPMTGLILESQGKKFAPPGAQVVQLTAGGKPVPRGVSRAQYEMIDLQRRSALKTLAPTWR